MSRGNHVREGDRKLSPHYQYYPGCLTQAPGTLSPTHHPILTETRTLGQKEKNPKASPPSTG